MTQVLVGLATIPDPIGLDVGMVVRSCHKSVIIKQINQKERNKEKKTKRKKKINEEKEKEN